MLSPHLLEVFNAILIGIFFLGLIYSYIIEFKNLKNKNNEKDKDKNGKSN